MADIVKMMVGGVGDLLAKVIGKEEDEKEIVVITEASSSHDLYTVLKQMVDAGRYCDAEDLLFEEIDKEYTGGKYLAGLEFYDMLRELGNEQLLTGNFSISEVDDGLKDLEELKEKRAGLMDEDLMDRLENKILPNFPKKKKSKKS